MKWFPNAHDVLDALGAWEDSYGTGNGPEVRAEAKQYAATVLQNYVWMQVFWFTTATLVLGHILRWAFP